MALPFAVLFGCSGRPGRVEVVDFEAPAAARKAIELYDTNGDHKLADDELRSVPGIFKWKRLYDLDADGSVSEQEIEQRIEKWRSDKLSFRSISANVTLDGRPVSHARVEIIPEPYLGESIKPASGITNEYGYASLSVAPDDLPAALKQRGVKAGGVYVGTYKISVTHPSRTLPQLDTKSLPLGDEIARDTVDASIAISLSSR